MSEILRRPWWPITAAVCIGVCIGVLAALGAVRLTTPGAFKARSVVVVDPSKLPLGVLRWDGEIDSWKLRNALLTDAILHQVVVGALPPQHSPEDEQRLTFDIRQTLYLTYTPRTQTVEVHYSDSDPLRAAEVVNLFARFFGWENSVRLATPAEPVVPHRMAYLAGVVGGLLGGLFVLVIWLLGRVAGQKPAAIMKLFPAPWSRC